MSVGVAEVDPEDPNFLRHALRVGTWERYEHPTKGDTLTLQIGQFPLLSLHALMVDGPMRPVESFFDDITDRATVALLLSKVARLQEQLQIAAQMIASSASEDHEGRVHECLVANVHDGSFSVICRCGTRLNEFPTSGHAKRAAAAHIDESSEVLSTDAD